LAGFFFIVAPTVLLFIVTRAENLPAVARIAETIEVLPEKAQDAIEGDTATERASYALAVFLFAPLAIIVPMTICTAVGANTIVGEKEKGTGEFLAHSPAGETEIYIGKLIASLVPGYASALVGFAAYSIVVNVLVGPQVGGWFFPTTNWWILQLWVVPPFLCVTLSVVLWLSARVRSAAAATQASGLVTLPLILLSYGQASGGLFGLGDSAGWALGAVAWCAAGVGLWRGKRSVTRARLLGVDDRFIEGPVAARSLAASAAKRVLRFVVICFVIVIGIMVMAVLVGTSGPPNR